MFIFAASLCFLLAALRISRGPKTFAGRAFAVGMLGFAGEALFHGWTLSAQSPEARSHWASVALGIQSLEAAIWLAFSLTYSRGNGWEFLARWRITLVASVMVPVALFCIAPFPPLRSVTILREGITIEFFELDVWIKALHIVLLVLSVLILMNLEQTFRASVGTMRWRIKFVILGIALIFGTKIYALTQTILFSGQHSDLISVHLAALAIGSLLVCLAYLRSGFAEIDVYPSQAILRTSLTGILVGAYLLLVGVLAQVVSYLGGAEAFEAQAFVVLLGVSLLGALLLSDRLRQQLSLFVGRNFKRARHDSLRIWTRASHELADINDPRSCSNRIARLISESFQVLSVSVWLIDEDGQRLARAASTASDDGTNRNERAIPANAALLDGIRGLPRPFDPRELKEAWAGEILELGRDESSPESQILCVPLATRDTLLGFALLGDRVNGMPYSLEEIELLQCLSEQCAAGLLNLRFAGELVRARELEAFQTMSAFFVHDLKNAASTLGLMLRNLPIHFDDPAFREDALRGISSTSVRINQIVERLSVFRGQLRLNSSKTDLNLLVRDTLSGLEQLRGVDVIQELHPVPAIDGDREQLQSMLTNLLLNAREATDEGGEIRVETNQSAQHVCLVVSDNGSGMSPAFVQESLFRPFRSTKKKGLGIGMFHSKMIVAAHGGTLHVQSELGKGTTFQIRLPAVPVA